MNKKPRGGTKRIEFEPKIPQNIPDEPAIGNKKIENSIEEGGQTDMRMNVQEESELIQQIKGMFAPKTLSKVNDGKIFNPRLDSFILILPSNFHNASLVIFTDNSIGIRMDDIVYECDYSFIGDGMVVEIGDSVRRMGNCDYILTAYNHPKSV